MALIWISLRIVNFLTGVIAVLMNAFFSSVFFKLSKLLKMHTYKEEMQVAFEYIFLMEFTNIACILLLTSFDVFSPLLDIFGISRRQANSFNPAWYMDTGTHICYIIFISGVVSNVTDLTIYSYVLLKRTLDRRCKRLKRDPDDEDDDDVNTARCKL